MRRNKYKKLERLQFSSCVKGLTAVGKALLTLFLSSALDRALEGILLLFYIYVKDKRTKKKGKTHTMKFEKAIVCLTNSQIELSSNKTIIA